MPQTLGTDPDLDLEALPDGLPRTQRFVWLAHVLDPEARPPRTADVLAQAFRQDAPDQQIKLDAKAIDQIATELRAEGLLTAATPKRGKTEPEPVPVAAVIDAYIMEPEATRKLADTLYKRGNFPPPYRPGTLGARRKWDFAFDYESFPLRTLLLLLAGRTEDFETELADLRGHNDWRNPDSKERALRLATLPLRNLDYRFWQHTPRDMRFSVFARALRQNAEASVEQAEHYHAFLLDPDNANDGDIKHQRTLETMALAVMHLIVGDERVGELHPRLAYLQAVVAVGGDEVPAAEVDEDGWPAGAPSLATAVWGFQAIGKDPEVAFALAARMKEWATVEPKFGKPAEAVASYCLGDADKAEALLHAIVEEQSLAPEAWAALLWAYAWTGLKPRAEAVMRLTTALETGDRALETRPYLRGEILNALATIYPTDPRSQRWDQQADAIADTYGLRYLLRLQPVPEAWEYALRILADVAGHVEETAEAAEESRLLWIVDPDKREVIVREQKSGKRGWSKGRKMSPRDLLDAVGTRRFEPLDERVIGAAARPVAAKVVVPGMSEPEALEFAYGYTLHLLENHPRVVLDDDRRIPLEVVRGVPELIVDEGPEGIRLSFVPPAASEGFHVEKETPTRYRVYEITTDQARLSRGVGKQTLIPAVRRAEIDTKLPALRQRVRINASSDLATSDLPEVSGDSRPCAHLLPYGVAYKLELYARPLPKEDFYARIGQGASRSAMVENGGPGDDKPARRILLTRHLVAEERSAAAIIHDCPTLDRLPHEDFEWTLDDDETALRVLLELRQLQREGRISVEHPKGERLRLVGAGGSRGLSLQVNKERDWFAVDGKFKTDEGQVLTFRQLLAHTRASGGQFVELEEGTFVAITEELRSRLEAIEGLIQERSNQATLTPLAALAFADLTDEIEDFEVDEAWQQNLRRIAETADFDPAVPTALQAELRAYQTEGYKWLRRLAEWGVGGCLADDMGLGKTVQALALLVSRAHMGPALVIAPASVTRNWHAETLRFAPTLRPRLLANSFEIDMLKDMAAGDLILVSYGLLSFVEEELLAQTFATIVLDEAQAIKNPATKRAKLVFRLQADMKLATTGTPIENHLGELWSLFRFINPGLLGSASAFNDKYANPIRRDGKSPRADQLRRLVQPFILRRRKEAVLKELPPKTEINLNVELSGEERALYEAMRRQAVEEITTAAAPAQRMIVLKQLTLLRQAACHPRLVRPLTQIPSAKLELIGETIMELLDNGHKALIFSQFVKHLKLVEAWVQAQNIKYCYLDGSTPGGKRQQQVDTFQRGEADLFLISLKAGGTGLNLTAADYVLHLDPWWNPAVEDQASDRAHRIGQERPVTVYRFVSAGTIEERILGLHAEKRDLADQILAGADMSSKLSVTDVLDLLRDV